MKIPYLNKREKILLIIFMACLLEIIFINFVIFPIKDRIFELNFNISEINESISDTKDSIDKTKKEYLKLSKESSPVLPVKKVSKMENEDGIFNLYSTGKDLFNSIDVIPISMRIERNIDGYNVKGKLEYFNNENIVNESLRDIYFKTKVDSEIVNLKESKVSESKSQNNKIINKSVDEQEVIENNEKKEIVSFDNRVKSLTDEIEDSELYIINGYLSGGKKSSYSIDIEKVAKENIDNLNGLESWNNSFKLNYSLNSNGFLSIPIETIDENISIPIFVSEDSRGNFKLLAHKEGNYYEFLPTSPIYPGRDNLLKFKVDKDLTVDGIIYEGENNLYEKGHFIFKEGIYSN